MSSFDYQGALQTAAGEVRALLDDKSGWQDLSDSNRTLARKSIQNNHLERSKQKTLAVAKATTSIPKATPADVVAVYTDPNFHKVWDMPTVSDNHVIESKGTIGDFQNVVVLHQLHKTLSAASSKRDLIVTRGEHHQHNGDILVISTSTTDAPCAPPVKPDFVRAELFFAGLFVEKEGDAGVKVTFLSCLDFTGRTGAWLHDKFVDQEITRVAQRLTKIKVKVQEKVK